MSVIDSLKSLSLRKYEERTTSTLIILVEDTNTLWHDPLSRLIEWDVNIYNSKFSGPTPSYLLNRLQ